MDNKEFLGIVGERAALLFYQGLDLETFRDYDLRQGNAVNGGALEKEVSSLYGLFLNAGELTESMDSKQRTICALNNHLEKTLEEKTAQKDKVEKMLGYINATKLMVESIHEVTSVEQIYFDSLIKTLEEKNTVISRRSARPAVSIRINTAQQPAAASPLWEEEIPLEDFKGDRDRYLLRLFTADWLNEYLGGSPQKRTINYFISENKKKFRIQTTQGKRTLLPIMGPEDKNWIEFFDTKTPARDHAAECKQLYESIDEVTAELLNEFEKSWTPQLKRYWTRNASYRAAKESVEHSS